MKNLATYGMRPSALARFIGALPFVSCAVYIVWKLVELAGRVG
jgi:hypothetical protein